MLNVYRGIRQLSLCQQLVVKQKIVGIPSDAFKTTPPIVPSRLVHTSRISQRELDDDNESSKWLDYNNVIFPPQTSGEERRPAYVCHSKTNIKYSPKKMWYVACFVRGMTVDEAVKQLSFTNKKGAAIVKDIILEAQELAVQKHNVEFKSNLWIAESFVGKGQVIKGMRRHAKGRIGVIHYRYCHYYVRLEEGEPPENYYLPAPKSGEQLLDEWMRNMHGRKIPNSL